MKRPARRKKKHETVQGYDGNGSLLIGEKRIPYLPDGDSYKLPPDRSPLVAAAW